LFIADSWADDNDKTFSVTEVWSKDFKEMQGNPCRILQSSSGEIYVLVMQRGDWGGHDILVIKTDSKGEKLWERKLAGTDDNAKFDVCLSHKGGIVISWIQFDHKGDPKYSHHFTEFNKDGKINDNETPLMLDNKSIIKSIKEKSFFLCNSISALNNGGYLLSGQYMWSPNGDDIRPFCIGIAKIDDNFNFTWQQKYKLEGTALNVFQISSKEFLVSTYNKSNIWASKVMASGEIKWKAKLCKTRSEDDGYWPKTYIDNQGNIYALGLVNNFAKADANGNILWRTSKSSPPYLVTSMILSPDLTTIAGGFAEKKNNISSFLLNCDKEGKVINEARYSPVYFAEIIPASEGGVIAALKKKSGWSLVKLDIYSKGNK
ncbi:MAG: hypothetical protein R6V10_10765, partial [bacterium]